MAHSVVNMIQGLGVEFLASGALAGATQATFFLSLSAFALGGLGLFAFLAGAAALSRLHSQLFPFRRFPFLSNQHGILDLSIGRMDLLEPESLPESLPAGVLGALRDLPLPFFFLPFVFFPLPLPLESELLSLFLG